MENQTKEKIVAYGSISAIVIIGLLIAAALLFSIAGFLEW